MKPPSSWKDMSKGEGCGERGIDCVPRKSGFWTLWSRFIPSRYGMCHPEIFFWANPVFPQKKLFSLLLRFNRKSWNTQCYLPSLVCFHPPKKMLEDGQVIFMEILGTFSSTDFMGQFFGWDWPGKWWAFLVVKTQMTCCWYVLLSIQFEGICFPKIPSVLHSRGVDFWWLGFV